MSGTTRNSDYAQT